MRRHLIALAVLVASTFLPPALPDALADPRPPDAMNAAELRVALRRLQVMGSVLYIGAHPDDDNTSALACLARGRLVRTVYLSLTRGDGGQNILGTEAGAALGVLRTQELLASRRVDGAEQLFTRALDYGFSKSPDEALDFWGHDRALADVVWVIRRYHPDVVITRFGTDGSGGHGHHTASAILAGEAFRAAADPARFPEQLATVTPWRAKRLLWNNWAARPDGPSRIVTLDVGAYDPELGLSYSEIGGRSRSLNRSQGAGTRERRGALIENFQHVDGDTATSDLFDGIDLTWTRVAGGAPVQALLHEAEQRFDPDHPAAILPQLARAHAAMAKLAADPLVAERLRDLEGVMRSCAGLWLEAIAETPTVSPGDTLRVTLTALARSNAAVTLAGIAMPFDARAYYAKAAKSAATTGPPARTAPAPEPDPSAPADAARRLAANQPVVALSSVVLPADAPLTQPYWLRRPALRGSFEVADERMIGDAEDAPAVVSRMAVDLGGERIAFDVPVAYRWNDRVYGDRYRAIEIVPPVTCELDQSAYLFADAAPREVRLTVRSTSAALAGTARLRLPAGWSADPSEAPVQLAAGAEQVVSFKLRAGAGAQSAKLGAEVEVGGTRYSTGLVRIDYPHVPMQLMRPECEAHLVRTDLRHAGARIAYLMGPGDSGPDALRQMGYEVTPLTDDDVERADLSRFDCVVSGVRAYNTRPRLRVLQPRLLEYVRNGGRLVVQYCTNDDALNDRLGPWPFKISRDRVTVEEAEMRFVTPANPLLRAPNPIAARDFTGWVQERGLNYANPWDPRYQAVLSANDPGEPPRDGGLLYTRYGKGAFVYTGLAFFRQLPAGVPGAWRLFANLVSPEPATSGRAARPAAASRN